MGANCMKNHEKGRGKYEKNGMLGEDDDEEGDHSLGSTESVSGNEISSSLSTHSDEDSRQREERRKARRKERRRRRRKEKKKGRKRSHSRSNSANHDDDDEKKGGKDRDNSEDESHSSGDSRDSSREARRRRKRKKKKSKNERRLNKKGERFVIYANGYCETAQKIVPWEEHLSESSFDTVILWTIHVHENADLYFNNHCIVSDGKLNEELYGEDSLIDLKERISDLKRHNKVVLFGIGSASVGDFRNIYNLMQTSTDKMVLMKNFSVLTGLGVDGYDLDNEEWREAPVENMIEATWKLLVELSNQVDILTIVPYNVPKAWLRVLQNCYEKCGRQIVSMMFLQCYQGGKRNKIGDWINMLNQNLDKIGLKSEEDVNRFILPGYEAREKTNGIINKFGKISKEAEISGGFIWNLEEMYSNVTENERRNPIEAFAQALKEGLLTSF